MTRTQIIFILALPIIFCLGVFLWQANPLFVLVPLGIAGIALIGLFISFVISAELTSFEAWDLLIRSVLFRLGFKVNPPKSLDDEEEHDHEHKHPHETPQPEANLKELLAKLMAELGAERGYIALKNEAGELEFQHGQGLDKDGILEARIVGAVAEQREAILTTNANDDPRYSSSVGIVGHSLRSVLAAPLIVDDKVIGVVYLDNRLTKGLFDKDSLAKINEFTQENAQSIEKARPSIKPTEPDEGKIAPPAEMPISEVEPEPNVDEVFDDEDDFDEAEEGGEIAVPSIEVPKPTKPITINGNFIGNVLGTGGVIASLIEKPASPETYFTAYYPRQVAAKTECGFYVYAHLQDALIESDVKAFSAELGGRIPKAVVAEEKATLQEGALLTVMIHCDKLKFNQMGAMQVWKAPFVRFDFKFSADESLIDEIVEGRVAILLGMIEIASIDFKMSVGAANPLAAVNALPEKPTLSLDASPTTPPYQKIFISYSRQDSIVAEQYRTAQTMLGNTIFMDIHSIRPGEDWEIALKRFITEADVFQLFWSEHSAVSEHVRFEWEYALKQRCPDTLCRQFIRPTYWQKPMPAVPEALNHLHFAYVDVHESKTGEPS